MSRKGLFITFEGGEGLGKSTLVQRLTDDLRGESYTLRCLREPGGTPIGEEIRHTLKTSEVNANMCDQTELLLLNGSRAQLVREVIRPSLAAGEIVISDRFYDSTVAYQGYGRGISLGVIKGIIDFAVGETRPDITLWIDGTPEQGKANRALQNTVARAVTRDRVEDQEDAAFFERVYQGFREIHAQEGARVKRIPYVHQNMDAMYATIRKELDPLLSRVSS